MKDEPTPPDNWKTPHERFLALGKKVLAVPRSEVIEREKKWQSRKPRSRKKT